MKEVQSGESVKKATPKQIRKERLRLAREEERGAREGLEPINDAELERLARQARKRKLEKRRTMKRSYNRNGVSVSHKKRRDGSVVIVIKSK
ncbi:hypothetical protein FDP41_004377 [Naegleria fowleri]|uniref:Uncharacterized protein n=1 Tax=Naegleria fowleri TaxID=5763 RepID=A0A6A5BQH5_NAEFO|nr:uncharacterized protein FDP41_004377 [Naegleria fowleri]KAF0976478.1 hypothetical protein FDP41_004377 [Naegleria fowleri]